MNNAAERLGINEVRQIEQQADLLHSPEEVDRAIGVMATDISSRLCDADLLVLPVMNGGLIPAGMLIPRLSFPLQVDYIHATRYRGDTSGRELHWKREPETDLRDRNVLLIDDIYDEGLTLAAVIDWCRGQGAKTVHTAVLFEKQHDRNLAGLVPDFVGMQVEDRYLFGYGMDYREYLRNAPGVFAVKGM